MNVFLYITLFLIGIVVGIFWRSAIYRIPRNISIMKINVSYFDSDDNKSKFSKMMLQLFFVLLSGISFVVFAKVLQIDANNLQISSIILYLFIILYLTTLVIIAGIDQKYIKIEKGVIISGVIISMIYMVYLYIIDTESIYCSTVCLGIYVALLALDTFFLRRYAKNSYTIGILMLLNIIFIFVGIEITIYTIITATIEILLYILISKIKQKRNGNKKIRIDNIPVGYFIGVGNIIILFLTAFVTSCFI